MKYTLRYFGLLFVLVMSTSFCVKANEHPIFKTNSEAQKIGTCFRAPFETYDTWLSMITKGTERRASREKIESKEALDEFIATRIGNFKRIFPQSDFDTFKQTQHCYTFMYEVDSIFVSGYVLQPKAKTNNKVIIYNRGGNGRYGYVNMALMLGKLAPLAKAGFTIIGTQYRNGSKPSNGSDDEFGGADVNDVVALTPIIDSLKNLNKPQIGMYGSSRGAMQSLLALKSMKNINALVLSAGVYDLSKELSFRPEMENVYKNRIVNYTKNKQQELDKRSAIKWLDKLPNVPFLILHGTADKRVSVANAHLLADELEKLNWPFKLVIYEDDDHGLSLNKEKSLNEIINWFNEHL